MSNDVRDTRKGTQRLSSFFDDVEKCLLDIFNDIGNDEFKQICSETLRLPSAGDRPTKIKDKMSSQMRNAITDACVREIRSDLEFSSSNLHEKLQTLCELEEKYKDREDAWRPPYDPVSHCRSSRVAAIKANLQSLQLLKSMKRDSISQLKEEIRKSDSLLQEKSVAFKRIEEKLDSFENKTQQVGKSLANKNDRLESALD